MDKIIFLTVLTNDRSQVEQFVAANTHQHTLKITTVLPNSIKYQYMIFKWIIKKINNNLLTFLNAFHNSIVKLLYL